MINAAPLAAMVAQFEHLLAVCIGMVGGYAIGAPIKRRIIKRWVKRG